MRDIRKLRTKYEVKLDNRHIAYLLLAELAVVVIVFGLGVVVGKGMGQLAAVEQAGPAMVAPPSAAEDRLIEDSPLTAEQIQLAALAITSSPEQVAETMATEESPLDDPALPAGEEITPPEEPATPPDMEEAPVVQVTTCPEAPSQGQYWTVQVKSVPAEQAGQAQDFCKRLLASGNQAMLEKTDLGEGRGVFYRVIVGQFATEAAAREFAKAVKQRENISDTWVREIP